MHPRRRIGLWLLILIGAVTGFFLKNMEVGLILGLVIGLLAGGLAGGKDR